MIRFTKIYMKIKNPYKYKQSNYMNFWIFSCELRGDETCKLTVIGEKEGGELEKHQRLKGKSKER